MAFLPNSTIYLCRVPFDSTQKNQVLFNTPEEQREYFISKQVDLLISYNIVRKTLSDGSLQSSIRVSNRIDDLRAKGVNYLCYQNAQHGAKWFYCFVEQLIYVSENCTEIIFRTDVFQTWEFEANIRDSYVVREHSVTDEIGDNIVPESFNFQEFDYQRLNPPFGITIPDPSDDPMGGLYNLTNGEAKDLFAMDDNYEIIGANLLDRYCYLMCSTEQPFKGDEDESNLEINGFPTGFHYVVCMNAEGIKTVMESLEDLNSADWLQSIVCIPKFAVMSTELVGLTSRKDIDSTKLITGEIRDGSKFAESTVYIKFNKNNLGFGGYGEKIKNNKLFTAPYCSLCITNNNGIQKDYPLEFFSGVKGDVKQIQFQMKSVINGNPAIYLTPNDFMGRGNNYDYAMTLEEFPQVSVNCDSYKLWQARNQGQQNLNALTTAIGTVTSIAKKDVMGTIGGMAGIANTIIEQEQAKRTPDIVKGGSGKNQGLIAWGANRFEYFWKTIKPDFAESVDNFFTMFGYQVNKVKTPNRNARKCFTYVQTIDINIDGGIPCDDLKELKAIYNNGVTIWQPHVAIGNYAVDNSPRV